MTLLQVASTLCAIAGDVGLCWATWHFVVVPTIDRRAAAIVQQRLEIERRLNAVFLPQNRLFP